LITVIAGKIFYKLVTEKSQNYKVELMDFLGIKGVGKNYLDAINNFDFNAVGEKISVKTSEFDLTIKVEQDSVVLLFGTKKDDSEFSDFIAGHFK
jgi:hypothetical protein